MEPALLAVAAIGAASLSLWAVSLLPVLVRGVGGALTPTRLAGRAGLLVIGLTMARVTAAAAESPPPAVRLLAPAPPSPPPGSVGEHTVVAGECLWRIAASVLREVNGREPSSAEIAVFWPRIYEANRAAIGADPDLILPGQILTIPEV